VTTVRKQLILDTISDAVTDLLDYDRKEDEDLPRGDIEEAVAAGEITVAEMVDCFRSCLEGGLA
jgi:hypothetical protein